MNIERRRFIRASSGLAVVSLSSMAATAAQSPGPVEPGRNGAPGGALSHEHRPVPLAFDPRSLKGLSERLVQSHWENNYVGAVKALNDVRRQLSGALADAAAPPYGYVGLKREQLVRTGSVVLHELYFGNLGGDGKADGDLRSVLARSFGSFDAWEREFRRIGLGLGGGSGWVVLAYNAGLGLLENYSQSDHAANPPWSQPILVMDMYEHAYHLDYGAAAARYIDAFFANIRWTAVAERLARGPEAMRPR